jgi:Fe-S-cluster-containing hydrogenase component 2
MICVDMEKCTGCRRCEIACAFFHTGRVSRLLARIKVVTCYDGIDSPVVCVQCKEQYCLECPANALSVGELGQIVSSPTVCTNCGACERLCPIGALELVDGLVYVCDLCGGRPQCVKACTESAIVYDPDGERPSLDRGEPMNPDKKRYTYVKMQGSTLRKKWRETRE